ncbi:hypothetical protein M378DRAFT_183092 [Amanita muscaria Koide BX008]|uniref:C3H1-type domain-containing protein n=1 Tax=Amanita muscaria (strain Koide BX008) TaxID=946122 RepID=A0A0C2TWB6_AMAMK|nr:hypothetical protein M378DRAFT_183092 [Amanita muscaria Koide BX008]
MASSLWNACSEGDLEKVQDMLKESSNVDIEGRDHSGITPLNEAVKNGHVEVVRALLAHGANSSGVSGQEPPETYTSDPAILDLLRQAQDKMMYTSPENTYHQESSEDVDKRYYGQPPAYPYYPPMNGAPPQMPDGTTGIFYPPPPPPPQAPRENAIPGGLGNLPPPDIARSIPCRYYPACRYGASCMFAHPQNPSYFPGPVPPQAHYMPYDPSLGPQPYVPNYYPVPVPAFQQQNGVPHMSPMSPPPGPPPLLHGHSPSELVPPASNPYAPNGHLPYGSMLPPGYPPHGQASVPMSVSPMSSVHPQLPMQPPVPQSPSAMYNQPPHPAHMYNGQVDVNGSYSQPSTTAPAVYAEVNGDSIDPSLPHQNGGFSQDYRDGGSHGRRGSGRKGSFSSRKPPCMFYPMGRCKNGSDCRFPHVPFDGTGNPNAPHSNRGGTRSRGNHGNTFTVLDEKLAHLNIRDVCSCNNGQGGRSTFDRGPRNHHGSNVNGSHANKKTGLSKQRVPNADDFPVLGGSVTPPARQANSLPNGAPTAAQVLQAPPPIKKESSQASTRGPSPDSTKVNGIKCLQAQPNGVHEDSGASTPTDQPQHTASKLPLSFAAAASSSSDVSKELAVPA